MNVGNGYDRSAVQRMIDWIFSANSQRVAISPKLSARWKCILRNGHSRSLQWLFFHPDAPFYY